MKMNVQSRTDSSVIDSLVDESETGKQKNISCLPNSDLKLQGKEGSDKADSITEDELLVQQILMPGEAKSEKVKKISFDELSNLSESSLLDSRDYVTGLPGKNTESEVLPRPAATNHSPSTSDNKVEMGNQNAKQVTSKQPQHIISENPQFLNDRRKVEEAETTGNCVPWSDNVFYKLFLDIEGRNARLMVLKCEITYVDVFTDEEHSLYKSRFIGGKADGVAELFAFDLMKADWEKKIPQSQAIELNVDIVMSSSPIYQCSETLLNLLRLEKSYLKHHHFDGQLNVMIRFAHAYAWDVKDDPIRERVHNGMRELFREGVNLEVMSADNILEEMKVDGILITNDDKIKHCIDKRHAWKGQAVKSSRTHGSSGRQSDCVATWQIFESSETEEDFEALTEDDMYHVHLLDKLDQLLSNKYRYNSKGILVPRKVITAGANHTVFSGVESLPSLSETGTVAKQVVIDYNYGDVGRDSKATSSRPSDLATKTDSYYVSLHSALWDIIQDTKRTRGILEETLEEN